MSALHSQRMRCRRPLSPALAGRPSVWLAAALLVCLLASSEAVAAEGTLPVLVTRVNEARLVADADEPALAVFQLRNLRQDEVFVLIETSASGQWHGQVSPNEFYLSPRETANVTFAFSPGGATTTAQFELTFQFVQTDTSEVSVTTRAVVVDSRAAPRVLDLFENPLPPPLDNAYGTFLLNMAFWGVFGLVVTLVGDRVVRVMAFRASSALKQEILHNIRRPLFFFVLFLGLSRSFAILPSTGLVDFISKTLLVIGIGVFGLYVLYKVLDSALLYYQQEISPRTASKLDDILVGVARKVGIVFLYIAGIVYLLRVIGWDPTLVFAGAGIVGLVIAFAAQATLSNLFAGISLMIDRPFVEGDEILLEGGEFARVESIGLRTTRLYQPRHHQVVTVPNNELATKRITNFSAPDTFYKTDIRVGVAYGSDVNKVTRVLEAVAMGHADVVTDGLWAPVVRFSNFGDSSLEFTLWYTVKNLTERFRVSSELRFAIDEAFRREDIDIPFPQRTLWMRSLPPVQLAEGDAPQR